MQLDRTEMTSNPTGGKWDWPTSVWTLWSIVAAFGTYFCMYGFRVPFKAGAYEYQYELSGSWLLDEKSIFVIAQVFGYTISKFMGIKFVSELPPHRRALAILCLIGFSELALLGFGASGRPWSILFIFLNGLPLGMVFGLVLGFLEGRQTTELLAAGLCTSFILADGFMKSIGQTLIGPFGEAWMPAIAGSAFVIPLLFFVWMLTMIPRPSNADESHRQARTVMNRSERWRYLRKFAWGLSPIIIVYLLANIIRSIRGDFARELWTDLGVDPKDLAESYAKSEVWVGLLVLAINGSCVVFRHNGRAYISSLSICAAGIGLLLVTCFLQTQKVLDPLSFMVLVGLGLYMPYVAIHTTVLERFIALTGEKGNLGYLMALVDSSGYFGYVMVLLARKFVKFEGNILQFFLVACCIAGAVSLLSLGWSAIHYRSHFRSRGIPAR